MSGRDIIDEDLAQVASLCQPAASAKSSAGLTIGELVGLTDDCRTPLVIFPGQPEPLRLQDGASSIYTVITSGAGSR